MNSPEEIWYVKHVNMNINARYAILNIRDQIRKAQSDCKEAYLSEKRMGNILHEVFNVVVK